MSFLSRGVVDFDEELPIITVMAKDERSDHQYLEDAPRSIRAEVEALQTELFESGFGADDDFVQKSCWDEAMRRTRKKWEGKVWPEKNAATVSAVKTVKAK